MSDTIDETDRKLIRVTQAGLPLLAKPYHSVAADLGLQPEEVKRRLSTMLAKGIIRRIGVVPNHYKLGMIANGMSVWDVEDGEIKRLGTLVGGLGFVSHCYHRPRALPDWPYNLFAMVHGKSRDEVSEKVATIALLLGDDNRGHEVLYSKRILKKTGLRLTA